MVHLLLARAAREARAQRCVNCVSCVCDVSDMCVVYVQTDGKEVCVHNSFRV